LTTQSYDTIDGETRSSSFLKFLAAHRQDIEDEIFRFLPRSKDIGEMKYDLDQHWKMVVDYPERGGKYVRPGFVLLATHASGGDVAKALTTAAAMEISENWLLVHDDFEDHSLQRRGRPALPILYGDEMAVNAGDHLHLLMWKMLMANREVLGHEKTFLIAEEMELFLQTTCEGQFLELNWTQSGRIVGEEEYFEVVDRKTGQYTIIGPLVLGAMVADNIEAIEPLTDFGRALGRAFQIHDDWLNVFSTKTGKELGGDIMEGKQTLLLIRLAHELERRSEVENLEFVKATFSLTREERDEEMVTRVIELYEENGCREWVRDRTISFADDALKLLNNVPISDEGKELLNDAVRFIIDREL